MKSYMHNTDQDRAKPLRQLHRYCFHRSKKKKKKELLTEGTTYFSHLIRTADPRSMGSFFFFHTLSPPGSTTHLFPSMDLRLSWILPGLWLMDPSPSPWWASLSSLHSLDIGCPIVSSTVIISPLSLFPMTWHKHYHHPNQDCNAPHWKTLGKLTQIPPNMYENPLILYKHTYIHTFRHK